MDTQSIFTDKPIFDIHVSTRNRATIRLIVIPLAAIAMIIWGKSLLPDNISVNFKLENLRYWSLWSAFGVILISAGFFNLLKEAIFLIRSYGHSGEWHFCLKDNYIIWDVPRHAHGKEIGFRADISEIKEIEFKTIDNYENIDDREYWVHFNTRDPIQLKGHSGVSISWLVENICSQGVPYTESYV